MNYLRLPSAGFPASSWEDNQLGLEHGIKGYSANLKKNLLVVLKERLVAIGGLRGSINPMSGRLF